MITDAKYIMRNYKTYLENPNWKNFSYFYKMQVY